MTDSETAFRDILYPVIKDYGVESFETRITVEEIIGYSKFAILDERGKVHMFGHYEKVNDRYYSNTRHLSRYNYHWHYAS